MNEQEQLAQLDRLVNLIANAKGIVGFTGAGISTESGTEPPAPLHSATINKAIILTSSPLLSILTKAEVYIPLPLLKGFLISGPL